MLSSSMMHAIKLTEKMFFTTSIDESWVSIYYQNFSILSQMNGRSLGDHIMKHVYIMYYKQQHGF